MSRAFPTPQLSSPPNQLKLTVPACGPIIARKQRVFPTLLPSLPSNVLSLTVPAAGLVHHTDRGGQYTVAAYRAALAARGVTVSMSGAGA